MCIRDRVMASPHKAIPARFAASSTASPGLTRPRRTCPAGGIAQCENQDDAVDAADADHVPGVVGFVSPVPLHVVPSDAQARARPSRRVHDRSAEGALRLARSSAPRADAARPQPLFSRSVSKIETGPSAWEVCCAVRRPPLTRGPGGFFGRPPVAECACRY